MDVTRAIMTHNDRPFFLVQLFASMDTVDCVRYHQQVLLYGVAEEEPRGAYALQTDVMETGEYPLLEKDINDVIFATQFTSMCPLVASLSGGSVALSECEAFSNGLLTRGLAVTLSEFMGRAEAVLDRRRRVRIQEGTLDGWVIPVRSYPYANDTCGDEGCFNYGEGLALSPTPLLNVHGDVPADWDSAEWKAERWTMQGEIAGADMAWLRYVRGGERGAALSLPL